MHTDYETIFEQRGAPYDRAMQSWPLARASEFERLFDRNPIPEAGHLVDFPAGGGYLSSFLPGSLKYTPLELTSGFGTDATVINDMYGEWSTDPADRLVCLAALHHMEDHQSTLANLLKHVKPDGVLHIADVAQETAIGRFLDEFVGSHNGMGHEGRYLSAETPLSVPGGVVERWELLDCPWEFETKTVAAEFCFYLFGLSDVSEADILSALDTYVGIEECAAGVRIRWQLLYADIRKVARSSHAFARP